MKLILNLVSDTNLFDGANQADVMALIPDISRWEAELIKAFYDSAVSRGKAPNAAQT